jgi:hypothetical protein
VFDWGKKSIFFGFPCLLRYSVVTMDARMIFYWNFKIRPIRKKLWNRWLLIGCYNFYKKFKGKLRLFAKPWKSSGPWNYLKKKKLNSRITRFSWFCNNVLIFLWISCKNCNSQSEASNFVTLLWLVEFLNFKKNKIK